MPRELEGDVNALVEAAERVGLLGERVLGTITGWYARSLGWALRHEILQLMPPDLKASLPVDMLRQAFRS